MSNYIQSPKLGFASQLFKNSAFNSIKFFVDIILSILLIPFIISKIGISLFGTWFFAVALANYSNLIDFGFQVSSTKFIAEEYQRKNLDIINKIINTVLFTNLILGGVSILIVVFISGFFARRFLGGISFSWLLIGLAVLTIVNIISNIWTALLNGIQRMDIVSKIGIVCSLLNAFLIYIFLNSGMGILGLLIGLYLSSGLNIILRLFSVRSMLPDLHFGLRLVNKQVFYRIFHFGKFIQVSSVSGLIHDNLDKILIGMMVALPQVSFYEIGSRIAVKLRELVAEAIRPIMPAASKLNTDIACDKVKELFFHSSKYFYLITIPLFVGSIFFAPFFIFIWIGSTNANAVLTLRLLSVAYLFNMLTHIPAHIFNGMGKPHYAMCASLFTTILNLLLSIALAIRFGFVGTLTGTAVSMVLAALFFLLLFSREINLSLTSLVDSIKMPLCLSIASGLFWYLILKFYSGRLNYFIFGCALFGYLTWYLFSLILAKKITFSELRSFFQT